MNEKDLNYEKAIKRIEEIVELLDDGSLELSRSIELFEEGTKLIKFCDSCLNKAQLKIKELSADNEKGDEIV